MKILEKFTNKSIPEDAFIINWRYTPGSYMEYTDARIDEDFRLELRRLYEGGTFLYIRYRGTAVYMHSIDIEKPKEDINLFAFQKMQEYINFLFH